MNNDCDSTWKSFSIFYFNKIKILRVPRHVFISVKSCIGRCYLPPCWVFTANVQPIPVDISAAPHANLVNRHPLGALIYFACQSAVFDPVFEITSEVLTRSIITLKSNHGVRFLNNPFLLIVG